MTGETSPAIRLLLADVDGTLVTPNKVLTERSMLFAHSGLSIVMGQSGREVHRAAGRVTKSNEGDGFAHAVDRFILTANGIATLKSAERT
jgi:hydroxymethylpyrimidine pyrophosphatase-like HAD family hydrolase